MRDEYDFAGAVRGKYVSRYAEGSNVVVLDPDVAAQFPDSESVNKTLRAIGHVIAKRVAQQAKAKPRKAPLILPA